jgi:hypothetical protein
MFCRPDTSGIILCCLSPILGPADQDSICVLTGVPGLPGITQVTQKDITFASQRYFIPFKVPNNSLLGYLGQYCGETRDPC